ncbi:unnamed protein product [Xylocopa violacea]|uniref:Uncharacterized protein n=1 Tax=Xylocopa violacea TaxID=135666 RepID=A0ABP1NK05_XYLVO
MRKRGARLRLGSTRLSALRGSPSPPPRCMHAFYAACTALDAFLSRAAINRRNIEVESPAAWPGESRDTEPCARPAVTRAATRFRRLSIIREPSGGASRGLGNGKARKKNRQIGQRTSGNRDEGGGGGGGAAAAAAAAAATAAGPRRNADQGGENEREREREREREKERKRDREREREKRRASYVRCCSIFLESDKLGARYARDNSARSPLERILHTAAIAFSWQRARSYVHTHVRNW